MKGELTILMMIHDLIDCIFDRTIDWLIDWHEQDLLTVFSGE